MERTASALLFIVSLDKKLPDQTSQVAEKRQFTEGDRTMKGKGHGMWKIHVLLVAVTFALFWLYLGEFCVNS